MIAPAGLPPDHRHNVSHLRLTVQHSSRQGLVTPSSTAAPTQRGNSEAHSHALYARRQSSQVQSCTCLDAVEHARPLEQATAVPEQ